MDFGKLENVDAVNWLIPPDDPRALRFLRQSDEQSTEAGARESAKSEFDCRFGAPVWARKEWVGSIYPKGTKAADFLFWYTRFFTCIEVNTTHYRIPTPEIAKGWAEKAAPGFRFCPKIFNGISHSPRGLLDRALLKEWLRFLEVLGPAAGPSFLQVAPSFGYASKAELFTFLQNWPIEFPLAIEFRHSSWFQGPVQDPNEPRVILPALVDYLQSRGVGLVITDVAGRRDVLHTSISASFSMLRFIGNDLHPSDATRATAWCERFSTWREAGLKSLYLFIHEGDDQYIPEMTKIILTELEREQLLTRPGLPAAVPRTLFDLGPA